MNEALTEAPAAPAAEAPVADDKTVSLDDHAALFGAQDPTLEGEAKKLNDEARAKVRHRARSQQASPEDAPRIAELTKRLRETEAERDALRKPAPTSPARADQPLGAPATPAAETGAARQAISLPPTRPEPSVDEIGTKYDTYEQFTRDLAKWDREQERAEQYAREHQEQFARQQSEAQQSLNNAHKSYAERLTAFKAEHTDFDTLIAEHGSIPLPGPVIAAILASDTGPAWSYHLMSHPDQMAELAMMFDGKPATEATIAHASRWLTARATVQAPAPAPTITLAPRPPNPVKSGAARTDNDGPGDDSMSIDAHEKAYGRGRRR